MRPGLHRAAVCTHWVMPGRMEAAEKAFLGVSLKFSMFQAAVGLPVPARGRTKPPALGAQRGLGIGAPGLGEVRAPRGPGS